MDYHEHSKISEYLYRFLPEDPKKTNAMLSRINALAGKSKDYGCYPGYPLSALDWSELDTSIGALLQKRRSLRDFCSYSISANEVATLLVRALGVNGELPLDNGETRPLRAHPSGGGLFPLECYVFLLNVDGLPIGFHHFDPYGPQLRCLDEGDFRLQLHDTFMQEKMLNSASMVVAISAVFMRSSFKYAERSYRFVHLEAGHMMQNLILMGQALQLSVVPLGGFLDRKLEELMCIDGVEESVIYTAAIGKPK